MKYFFILSIYYISLSFISCSFQTSFFKAINKDFIGKNLIVSPLSIYQVLGLTTNGAQGNTQKEMLEVLGNTDISELNEINYDIIDLFKDFSTVELANAIMTKFTPKEDFCDIAEKYLAPMEELKSVSQVNKWCSEKTHGKIEKIIEKLDPDVKMVLLNAIYFKGEWSSKFKSDSTSKRVFYNLNSEENVTKIDSMVQTTHFRYYENSEVQAVELMYQEDQMSAIVILPQKEIDINDFIDSLDEEDNLSKIVSKLDIKKVHLHLPKFKVTFKESLVKVLKKMGIKIAFSDSADFYGMRNKDEDPLKIGEVIHKTFLDVNEEGTEAAAVTIVEMTKGAMPGEGKQEIIYEMDVNRPFLLLLMNRKLPKGYDLLFMSKIEELQ